MDTLRKITVEISSDLLEKAQQASGTGVTQIVRTAPGLPFWKAVSR